MCAVRTGLSDQPAATAHAALRRGVFVTFEGPDGCGKTTVARGALASVEARGFAPAALLREPGQSAAGQRIRALSTRGREGLSVDEEIALFLEDRRWDVETNIAPMLARQGVVLLDRYYHSSIAYQGARGADPERIRRLNEAFAPRPDRIILLRLSVDTCLERIRRARGGEPDLFEQREQLERVIALFDAMDDPQIVRLDASQPLDSLQAQVDACVHEAIAAARGDPPGLRPSQT